MTADQMMVYAMMACFMVMIFLNRHDAYKSVSRMGEILHEAQKDSVIREESTWKRARVELDEKSKQLQEAHRFVLRAKIPIHAGQSNFRFPDQPENGQPPRPVRSNRMPDSATLG